MSQAQQVLTLTLGLLALAAVIGGYYRWWRPRWERAVKGARLWWATQIGTEAIHHPVTGDEIQPAQKGIAHRLYAVEQGQERQAELMERVIVLMEAEKAQNHRIDEVEARVTILEAGAVERTIVRAESAAMLNLVAQETAANMPPDTPDLD